MTTRITEDILLALIQLGMADQSMLVNVKHVVQAELAKYDIKPRETAIAIRDNSDVDMVARFFVAKTSAGLSARTLKMYSTTLQRLLKRLNRKLKEVTTDDIRVMLTNMRMEGIELVSIDNDRRVLSSFFGWLYSEGFIKSNPMKRVEKVRFQKKIKKAFTEEEMEMLRINAKCDRDKAIIEFLFSTGCRVTECEQLNRNDLDFNLRECTVLGKGNKERRVFLSPRCAAVLQLYLKSRKDKDPALFVSPFRWVQDKDGKMVRDDDNFSATDWAEEFRGQYKTPMQLIEILQDTAKLLKEGIAPNRSKSYWQDVLEQCKGWEVDTDNEYAGEAR
ncbi:MAG: tyrosine-type recombinase/integrase [Bacteroidaceae bacterium]|nr:tyrosine-type recombinase/integrase [Bacteroidaceae bacterium]